MVLKVSFSNQIHRISKTPVSYQELVQLVAHLFHNQLPERWTLQYVDSDGDSIMLADEHDFQNLLEGELSDAKKTIKVNVIPVNEINQSHVRPANESVYESASENQKEDDFQVIEKQEPVLVEEPKVEQLVIAEEPKVEALVEEVRAVEMVPLVQQEEPKVEVEQEVVQNVVEPEQKEEVRPQKMRFGKKFPVKKILKKLAKSEISAEKKQYLESKLSQFEATLAPEDRERFEIKKQKYSKILAEKKAKVDSDFKEKVTDIIYQYLPTIASLTKEYVQEDKPQPEPVAQPKVEVKPATRVVTHNYVRCDGCSKRPITGIRYKCYVCPDFDFCEECEATKEHPHPFIKIRDSEDFNSHRRGPRPFPHMFGGRNCWNVNRQENKQEQPKAEQPKTFPFKSGEPHKLFEEVNMPDLKNLVDNFFGNVPAQPTENKEAQPAENKEHKEKAENMKKEIGEAYKAIPHDFKSLINGLFGNLPEKIFGEKTESKSEEVKPEEKIEVPKVDEPKVEELKKEEVVIAEEPVVNEVKAEVIENAGPVIQVVENVPEINKEDPKPIKKEYSEEVRSKVGVMREIFPDINEEDLLEFVSKTPNLTIQELVENYLA